MTLIKRNYVSSIWLLFLLLSTLVLVIVLSTNASLNFVIKNVVQWVPGLEIKSVSGKWNNFTMKKVRYQIPDFTVEIGEFQLAIDFSCLLHHKLCINVFSLRNVSLQVKKKLPSLLNTVLAIANTEHNSLKNISIPYSLSLIVRNLTLDNIQMKWNNINIQLHQLRTGLILRDTKLVVKSTFISGLLVKWPKTALVTPNILLNNKWMNVIKFNAHIFDQSSYLKILLNLFTQLFLQSTLPFDITIEETHGRNLHFIGLTDIWINQLYLQSKTINKQAKIIQLYFIFNQTRNLATQKTKNINRIINLSINCIHDYNKQWNINIALQDQGNLNLIGHIILQPQQVLLNLNARRLCWGNLNLQSLTLKGNILLNTNINSHIYLQWYQLQNKQLKCSKIIFIASGYKKQHKIMISMQGIKTLVSGKLQIQGCLDLKHKLWQGKINKVSLVTPTGVWLLAKDIRLNYAYQHQKIIIGSHYWQNNYSYIYIPNDIEISILGKTKVQLKNFDLSMLRLLIPTTINTSGLITGSIEVNWNDNNQLPYTKITLIGHQVKLSHIANKQDWHAVFDTFVFNTRLDQYQVSLNWAIKIDGNSQFNCNIHIKDLQQKCYINGNIQIKNLSMLLLKPIIKLRDNFDSHIEGLMNAVLSISGNIKLPLIDGRVKIDRLIIQNNILPVSMTESQLVLSYNGTRTHLQGLINTTHGKVYLTGYADWRSLHAWHIYIAVKGNNIRIYMPSMRFDISPHLIFEATPKLLTLNGQVNIPWMRIQVKNLQQTIADLSLDDHILLDKQLNLMPMFTGYKKIIALPIVTNLLLHLNNDVQINAFGLKANLIGNLRVTKDKDQPLLMNGKIYIPYGYYYAYNKDLIIQKGYLLFANEIDQPNINIEAIRNPNTTVDNIITGVRVTGKIKHPKLEIFSHPVKSKQEALSLLLQGHGIDVVNTYDKLITSIFISMGTTRSAQLLKTIGEILCLHQITLNLNEDKGHYQFMVSGYINPKLRLTSSLNTVNLFMTINARYHLMPNIDLEAILNDKQTMNVIYQFNFN